MLLSIPIGTTSKIVQLPVYDSSSTIGAKLAGLVFNTASLTAYYNREGAAGAAVAIALATATKGTWATGGFVAIDATNIPGAYELHLPDAALASGARSVLISLKGAANMVPVDVLIELTAVSNQDAVRGGMTALPASGTLAVNPTLAAVTHTGAVIPTVTTLTGHTAQTGDNFARLGAPAGASVSADVAAVKADTAAVKVKTDFLPSVAAGAAGGVFIAGTNAATTITTGLTTTFTGSLTGSVGSVTGAVGSVTGLTAANLDATISSRMATFTQPTGFLAATFPGGTVANTTNVTAATGVVLSGVTHTGAVIPTVTTLTGHTAQTGDNFPFANRTVIRGTVGGAPAPSTTAFTASALSPSGVAADQFKGRVMIFDNATTTTSLRGQATTILTSSAAALPAFTYTALTTAPVSGDTFSLV